MAASPTSNDTNFKRRINYPLECRPRMLKDFLTDDSNSCSSSGFKSFPRRPTQNQLPALQRSRSKAAASTISPLQAVFAAVKRFHALAAVKSPSIFPRSLSRRRSERARPVHNNEVKKITVTIKDIIRWRSFRDLTEDVSQPPPLGFASPHGCTTATVRTGSTSTATTTTPCSSSGSSWCDSDFTVEDLPSRSSNSGECCEKFYRPVGKHPAEATTKSAVNTEVGTTEELEIEFEEQEQQSPMSVLDVEYEEDEDVLHAAFNHSLANMESSKQKLMQKIRRFKSLAKWDPLSLEKSMTDEETAGSVEEDHDGDEEEWQEQEETDEVVKKARQLLEHIKATTSPAGSCCMDKLLLGFFTEALMASRVISEIVEEAESWIDGEQGNCNYERDLEEDRGRWSKCKEEQEEVAMAIESGVVSWLVDELVADLFSV